LPTIPNPPESIKLPVVPVLERIFPVIVIFVNVALDGVTLPIALGEENVFPFKNELFKFGITVVLETINGGVPVVIVLVMLPVTFRLVPVATPILGAIKVGLV
jgi:hypothetical protein